MKILKSVFLQELGNLSSAKLLQSSFLFLIFIFVALSPLSSFADAGYDGLRARYLRLRNVDPEVKKESDWIALSGDLQDFVKQHPQHEKAPLVLYDASIVFEILYKKSSDANQLRASVDLLKRIVDDYATSRIAPDALMRLGDLTLFLRNSPDEATSYYHALLDRYGGSELTAVARERLARIRSDEVGKFENSDRASKSVKGNFVVVLDPGHGGEDLGAQGVGGLLEKDVTLAVAGLLKRKLQELPGVSVRLTRESDVFVPLQMRSQIANEAEANLFVSLHVNASVKKNVDGYEVYYLDNTNDASSQRLADRENASMQYEGAAGDLMFMLSDLITTAKVNESISFAREFYASSLHAMKQNALEVRGRGVKKAPLYVLVGTSMPSILVEMLFVDNDRDGKKLASEDFRVQLASSIFQGLKNSITELQRDEVVAQK